MTFTDTQAHVDDSGMADTDDWEPSPWVDEDGHDRTPGADLDLTGGWL